MWWLFIQKSHCVNILRKYSHRNNIVSLFISRHSLTNKVIFDFVSQSLHLHSDLKKISNIFKLKYSLKILRYYFQALLHSPTIWQHFCGAWCDLTWTFSEYDCLGIINNIQVSYGCWGALKVLGVYWKCVLNLVWKWSFQRWMQDLNV